MGSRLFGNATSLLGGHDFGDPAHRAHVAGVLGLDEALIPPKPGYAYDQILDAIERGEIRGMWVVATNTAHSWINQTRAREILGRLDFLVVQDMYATTETAQLADLVLPAAGWGEKEGVVINSERRLGVVRKVARAPGQALSDFAIFKLIAEAWGCGALFQRWTSPAATFQLLKQLTRGRPCDFSGIEDYEHLMAEGGIQWPWPATVTREAAIPRERRLFENGEFHTPDRRARFIFDAPVPMPERPDAAYPFLLMTGRGSSAQWHTGSRTNKSAVLRKLAPTVLTAEINPLNAAHLGIANGDRIRIRSRRGEAEAVAVVTATIAHHQLFLPMHFESVNQLTYPALDPHSRQPSYKACAVAVEKIGRT
jgi:assimilatory nitrate reductase catalytic subunit